MYFPSCFNGNEHDSVSAEMSTLTSDRITIGFSSQDHYLVSQGHALPRKDQVRAKGHYISSTQFPGFLCNLKSQGGFFWVQ